MIICVREGRTRHSAFPFHFSAERSDDHVELGGVLRIIVLVLSTGAMLAGIAVMAGLLVPQNVPGEFRFLIGVVIFLYGAYRFSVGYFRKKDEA